jgi:uncharacterized protein (DUF697 family)
MPVETVERSEDPRDEAAARVVSSYAAWAAVAGIIPVPVADVVAIGALQLQMLRKLAEIYGTAFSDNLGKSVLASLAGSILPASVASTAAYGVASALKAFPLIGTSIASVSMPALSAGSTYAIGKVFIQHFSSGGSLLNFDPNEYREFMKAQAEKRANMAAAEGGAPAA